MTKITFLLGLLLCIEAVKGQQGDPPLVPCMFVDRATSQRQVRLFNTISYGTVSKQQVFDAAYGGAHPKGYTYSVTIMEKLIAKLKALDHRVEGFRIYFSAYGGETAGGLGTVMAGVKKNQVILIFAAAKGWKAEDIKKYYIISSDGQSIHNLPIAVAQRWVNNYFNLINNEAGLVSTIENNREDNLISRTENTEQLSDTKSIYYDTANFCDFMIAERRYQDSIGRLENKPAIESIQIDFAAYPPDGIGPNIYHFEHDRFKSRLILQFEFKSQGRILYIDQTPGHGERVRRCPLEITPAFASGRPKADNGQLCPSQCPPKTGLD